MQEDEGYNLHPLGPQGGHFGGFLPQDEPMPLGEVSDDSDDEGADEDSQDDDDNPCRVVRMDEIGERDYADMSLPVGEPEIEPEIPQIVPEIVVAPVQTAKAAGEAPKAAKPPTAKQLLAAERKAYKLAEKEKKAVEKAAKAAAKAAAPPVVNKHTTEWAEVDVILPYARCEFSGTPGPTYAGETTCDAEELKRLKTSKLFFFQKFIDNAFTNRIVKQTNKYVSEMKDRPRPSSHQKNWSWPPKWTGKWKPITVAVFMQWLALLMFMGLNKTANEDELWSTHWLWQRPEIQRFFSRDEHQRIKAALHCQSDEEILGELAQDGKQQIKKIGIPLDDMREKSHLHFNPFPDISYDEISVQMSGRCVLKKQIRNKPIGAGIQFFAFAHSYGGAQYLYDFELDRNDQEDNKVQRTLLRMVKRLPENSKNHRVAADNLFNSVESCIKVEALGHRIYGTIRMDSGVPEKLKAKMETMTNKGDVAIVMSPKNNISIVAWHDSKVAVCISNVHPPAVLLTKHRMKGKEEKVSLPCPVQFVEYNFNMGGIDDFDRLLSFFSVKLRCVKWWHAIFYFIIDLALVNALFLWRWENPKESATMQRRTWIAGLIEEIIKKYGDRNGCKWVDGREEPEEAGETDSRPDLDGGRGGSHIGMALAKEAVGFDARLSGMHLPVRRETRGNCALCYMHKKEQRKVWNYCETCKVMLHVPECFYPWHTSKCPKSPFTGNK